MLSKLSRPLRLKRFFQFSQKNKKNEFVFQTEKKPKRKNPKTKVPKEPPITKAESSEIPVVSEFDKRAEIIRKIYDNNPYAREMGTFSVVDWLQNGGTIEDFACEENLKYPLHIDHWNPQAKGYVPAER